MRFLDRDWRQELNSWDRGDIAQLRAICDEKINQIDHKRFDVNDYRKRRKII